LRPVPDKAAVLSRLRAEVAQPVGQEVLPVSAPLAGLLPDPGLRRGAAYALDSAGALLLALLAEPSRAGTWCGVIGVPDFGVEAAELAGVRLDRLVLVPEPGGQWLSVTAALADVFGVVVVRPPARAREADAARLAARLRERGTVLLSVGPWPAAVATLSVEGSRWSGLGPGYGYLAGREAIVLVTSKRAPVPRRARLLLPDGQGRLARLAPVPEAAPEPLRVAV
jgi:hypothetical protein